PRGIKNFTLTREQGSTYYLHLVYDSDSSNVFYMRSTNYGLNWTPYDTSDGDMPHLAVAGVDGLEDIFLTWRLDGPEGALYTSDDHGKVKKNKDFANNKWYLTPNMATSDTAFCIYQHEYSGRIYVGTGNSGDIYRSEDGGGSWSLMPDLSGAEFVYDIVGQNHTSNIVAATGEPARIFLWYMGVWQEKLELGAEDAFLCLAYDRTSGHFFAGSTPGGEVYKSTNGGDYWFECGEISGLDKVHTILVTDSGTVLVAGYYDDSPYKTPMFRSTNGGSSWNIVGDSLYHYRCLLQAQDGTIYAAGYSSTAQKKFMKSTNDGVSWTYLTNSPIYPLFICEGYDGTLYIGNNLEPTYRSTNGGSSWEQFSGSTEATDMIQSHPYVAVKKSTNLGTSWGATQIVSEYQYDVSDPKIAAGQGTSSYKVWIVFSQKDYADEWELRHCHSSDQGGSWSSPPGNVDDNPGEKQLPALKGKRGTSGPIHVAYVSDKDGTERVYWADVMPGAPSSWGTPIKISTWRSSTLHCPELTFVSTPSGPGIFYCRLFGIPIAKTRDLFFDAEHFTDVEEGEEELSKAKGFSLSQNYPNPFNPVTSIQYTVHSKQSHPIHTTQKSVYGSQFRVHSPIHTTLTIYNVLGQKVRTLVDEVKLPGEYKAVWDGKDEKGNPVSSGVYFYELKVDDLLEVKKMLLIK
ncbi:MAG: hypothetical protein AMS23_05955, partial [Bacteroides sp. SM1_62]